MSDSVRHCIRTLAQLWLDALVQARRRAAPCVLLAGVRAAVYACAAVPVCALVLVRPAVGVSPQPPSQVDVTAHTRQEAWRVVSEVRARACV
jgi:hypothetical protein